MNKIAGNFFKAAVVYGLIGLALGVYMGASHDFTLRAVHVHIALIGWVNLAVCAFYYHLVPEASRMSAAKAHFWIANIGIIVIAVSLTLMLNGVAGMDPGTAAGSVISFAAFVIFAYVVFKTGPEKA